METREILKIILMLSLYLLAPVAGALMYGNRNLQRATFAVMAFMTIGGFVNAQEWGFTLANEAAYRGHSRGYHFYFAELLALALVGARFLETQSKFRWFPPGLLLYLFYVAVCMISFVNAPSLNYGFMAALKAVKIIIIFLAAYHYFRNETDMHVFLVAMTVTMAWQCFVVLRMKYWHHMYQIPGTFDHQNALSMYSSLIGMVLLAASLGPKHPTANIYLLGFVFCAVVQQATLSRAGLVIFAAGTIGVCLFSLWDRITRRRVFVLSVLSTIGIVGAAMSLDTIVARFGDRGNEASNMTRVLLNESSRRMVADYPLGIGWNNFALTINRPWPYGKTVDDWEREGNVIPDLTARKGVVESWYYLHLAENGYLGLVALLLFISAFLWWNVRGQLFFRYHLFGVLSLGIGMGCLANYLHGTLERVLTQPRNMMLWMILLGLASRIEAWRRIPALERRRARKAALRAHRLRDEFPKPAYEESPRREELAAETRS